MLNCDQGRLGSVGYFQSVVFSSTDLKSGSTLTVYTGGSSAGAAKDGLYTSETYTPGLKITSFTISSILTTAGSSTGGLPGGGRR